MADKENDLKRVLRALADVGVTEDTFGLIGGGNPQIALDQLRDGNLSEPWREFLQVILAPDNHNVLAAVLGQWPLFSEVIDKYKVRLRREQQAQASDSQDLIDDYMRAFGEGYKSAIGFANTSARLAKAIGKEFQRPNEPPPFTNPWECRIGASRFFVPPLNVSVSQSFRTGSLTGGVLRQQNSPKFNTGHSETIVNMVLYFPNQESIWGIGGKPDLDINFDTDDVKVIDRFLSSLRGLITQFKYAPILPIRNAYLNQAFGITGVVLQSMTIGTMENYPFCLAVNLQLLKFNHKVYLPMLEDFNQSIHWGKYRQYMGRAAQQMQRVASQGFLLEDKAVTKNEKADMEAVDRIHSNKEGLFQEEGTSTIDFENKPTARFSRQQDWMDGKYLDLYYPTETPLQVFGPDLSMFRSQGEDESHAREKNLFESFLGFLDIDVDTNPDAAYDNVVTFSNGLHSGDFKDENFFFLEFAKTLNAGIEGLNDKALEDYTQRRFAAHERNGRNLTPEVKAEIRQGIRASWLSYILENFKFSPFFQALARDNKIRDLDLIIKEFDVPMEKLNINWDNVIVDGVNVSLSNNIARLQVQLQAEPVHQHIGGGDSTVDVSMTIFGEEDLVRFRRMFEHINGLARLEHAHGVLGFLGVKNVVTSLCGVKYVLPTVFEIDAIPNFPHIYNVRMSFVDFDVFQSKREFLDSSQQKELVDAFGKRNPFLRVKQLWGAFNAYPDFPLSVKDDEGKIIGCLDPDFYFKSFQTIDDDVAYQGNAPTADTRPRTAGEILAEMERAGEIRPRFQQQAADRARERALIEASNYEQYGSRYSPADQLTDGTGTGNALDYSGIAGYGSVTQNYQHTVTHHLGLFEEGATTSQVVELRGEGIGIGSTDIATGETSIVHTGTMMDDVPDTTLQEPSIPNLTPYAQHQTSYADSKADPKRQFELMMLDTQYRDISGRMVRAFPTYMLWLIDEGGNFAGTKLFDNFYGLQSVIDFSLVQSEDILGDTLSLRVSNIYGRLTTNFRNLIGIDRSDEETTPLENIVGLPFDVQRNLDSGTQDDYILDLEHVRLKPGVRLHLRCGYSSNPNSLPTVFNGVITTVETGDIITITAQSDAIELSPYINTTNKAGHSGKIDGAFNTGLWLSEPRDLMVRLLSMGASSAKEALAHAFAGQIFSENRFGIRHFGQMLYEPLGEGERQRQEDRHNHVQAAIDNITHADTAGEASGALVDTITPSLSQADAIADQAEADGSVSLFGAYSGNALVRTPVVELMRGMWTNFFRKRDYEIFKRNIYPGNGLGVAQFLGGDMGDGGLTMAINGSGEDNLADPTLEQGEINDVVRAGGQAGQAGDDDLRKEIQGEDIGRGQGDKTLEGATTLSETITGIGAAGATGGLSAIPLLTGVFSGKYDHNPFMNMLGITSDTDDDPHGFDEVSFRAQTYMKSVWDLFELCAALLPNYIVAVRPFEDRSTVFYGKPHWLYTSGVVPLTTGIPKEDGPKREAFDSEQVELQRKIAEEANPIHDLEEQEKFYQMLTEVGAPAGTTGASAAAGVPWAGGDVNSLRLDIGGVQYIPKRTGKVVEEMHLPTSGDLKQDIAQHRQLPGLKPERKHPYYMDRVRGARGGVNTGPGSKDVNSGTELGEDPTSPGQTGSFGYLPPDREQFYCNMLWSNGNHKPLSTAKIVFLNQRTNKAVICTPGETGPGASTGFVAGFSPDSALAVDHKNGDMYTFGFADDNTQAGPASSLESNVAGSNQAGANFRGQEAQQARAQQQADARERESGPRALPDRDKIADWFDADAQKQSRNPAIYAREHGSTNAAVPVYLDLASGIYTARGRFDDIGYMARLLYDADFLEKERGHFGQEVTTPTGVMSSKDFADQAGQTFSDNKENRDDDLAESIWDQFRKDFHKYSKTGDASGTKQRWERQFPQFEANYDSTEGPDGHSEYFHAVNRFKRFMWEDAYNRAWLVVTVSRHVDRTDIDIGPVQQNIDLHHGDKWDFSRAEEAWSIFIDQYDKDHKQIISENGKIKSTATTEYMKANASPGSDADTFTEELHEAVSSLWNETIGKVVTAASTALSALSNIFRLSMMQLGQGLGMVDHMQQQANILNKVFNDSIYYAAGSPGSLLRMADNPFTREYGEPVVEIREPFQRMHYIDSFQHIIGNTVQERNDVATVITASSDGKYPVTVYFDKGAPAERQMEQGVETGLFWDNLKGSGFFGFLHPLLHPVETARGAIKTATGSSDELLSKRVGLYHLKESLKDVYGGEILILGDPDIRPHDLIYMADVYERMYGMFEVEQVVHHFTPDMGFVTAITPNAIVTINDPARWSMISWAWSWWAVKNMRDDTRNYMNVTSDSTAEVNRSDTISATDLAQSLGTQFRGHLQYTQGSSGLVKDLAASSAAGLYTDTTVQDTHGVLADVAPVIGVATAALPLFGGKLWDGWEWVRDNLLDQHGCYIQYLTKDGQPMDGGLSYNQGVSVGSHHSIDLLPGILGVESEIYSPDGHKMIRSNDLLAALGWNEVDVSTLVRETSWWVSQTNAQVLKLSGQSPDPVTFDKPQVIIGIVDKVIDGDTITLKGQKDSIRFAGIGAPEVLFKEFNDPENPELQELTLNSLDNLGRRAQEYAEKRLINDPIDQGYDPTVAIRINPSDSQDIFGRTLGVIFHNVPFGTPPDKREEVLKEIAEHQPLIEWDQFMDDGRPYTINWEMAMAGLALTDLGGLQKTKTERGGDATNLEH